MRPPQRHPCPVRARKTRTTKSVGSAVAKVSGELVLHAMDSTCYHALVVVTHALSPFDRTHCRRPLFYPCGCTGSVKYTPQGWYVVAQPRRPLSCTSAQRPMQAPRSSRWRVAPGTDHHPPFLLLRVFAASRPGSSTARRNTASSALTSSSSSRSVMTTCAPPELSVSDLFWGLPMHPRPHRERVSISHRRHLLGQAAACSRDRHV